jgi:hypothetical protein
MPRYVIDRREGLSRDDTPERVQAWLRAHGHPNAEVVSTGFNPHNGNLRLTIESDNDPQAAVMAYAPELTPRERFKLAAMADGRAVIKAIADKPRGERGPVEKALLGLAVMVGDIAEGLE